MLQYFVYLDYLGVFSFAINGLLVAREKNLDVFGGIVVAFVSALGGGSIRDLLLDVPVTWINNVFYIYIVLAGALTAIVFKKIAKKMRKTLFLFDTVGLGVFTIIGVQKALNYEMPIVVVLMFGIITATFGGVVRDVICNEIPLLFRKEIYALAAMAGAVLYIVLHFLNIDETISVPIAVSVVIGIRVMAVLKKLSLPVLNH